MLPRTRCEDGAVSVDGEAGHPGAAPALPWSIWVVAWASMAGQTVLLVQQGLRRDDAVSLFGSALLGALLVGYISAGVIRARTVRLVIAWVVLVIVSIIDLVDLFSVDDSGKSALLVVSLATTVVVLAGLATFHRTDWCAWQRTKPSVHDGAPIGRLVAISVIVGVLGGLAVPVDDGLDVSISVASR